MGIKQLISGGQTGVDQLALEVARSLGIPTGGWAPKGFRTEDGPNPDLGVLYGLQEAISSAYPERTRLNVEDTDGTVWFGSDNSSGALLTIGLCKRIGRHYRVNPTVRQLRDFIQNQRITILNVAGNRASKCTPQQLEQYRILLIEALTP